MQQQKKRKGEKEVVNFLNHGELASDADDKTGVEMGDLSGGVSMGVFPALPAPRADKRRSTAASVVGGGGGGAGGGVMVAQEKARLVFAQI